MIDEKIKAIRLFIADVDGVFTDGKLYYSEHGESLKVFHAHDGHGVRLMIAAGIHFAVITKRRSIMVDRRFQELGVPHIYQGVSEKESAYEDLKQQLNLKDSEIAYIGDDLPDLPLLKRVGCPIAVANAHPDLFPHVIWKTERQGGDGAVRECCDRILRVQQR